MAKRCAPHGTAMTDSMVGYTYDVYGIQVPLKRQAAWALSSLAKGANTSAKPFYETGLFPILIDTLSLPVRA